MPFSLLFLAVIVVGFLIAACLVGNLPDDRAASITPIMVAAMLIVFLLGLIAQIVKSP